MRSCQDEKDESGDDNDEDGDRDDHDGVDNDEVDEVDNVDLLAPVSNAYAVLLSLVDWGSVVYQPCLKMNNDEQDDNDHTS